MWNIEARKEMHAKFCWGKSEEKDRSKSLYLRWNKSIRLNLKENG
jgi:hypothetical protein